MVNFSAGALPAILEVVYKEGEKQNQEWSEPEKCSTSLHIKPVL